MARAPIAYRQTIIHAKSLSAGVRKSILAALGGKLTQRRGYFVLRHSNPVDADQLSEVRTRYRLDINPLPRDFDPDRMRLFVTDMDSTLISIECIDEIADRLNIKSQVAAITEAAMQGNIDFETALERRVKLLAGLSAEELGWVYKHRLDLNPGAERMLDRLSGAGIKIALVSGGFTFFTDRLKRRLPIDFSLANTLQAENGVLTGGLEGKLIGAEAKADFLLGLCRELNIAPRQTVAVGDGANDLRMLGAAGLSVAYRAQPALRSAADAQINYSDLESICHLLLL